jgi:hypothetical protein
MYPLFESEPQVFIKTVENRTITGPQKDKNLN